MDDWGACGREQGPWSGKVVFEHDGCDQFSASKSGWGGARPSAAQLPFAPDCEDARVRSEGTAVEEPWKTRR